MFSRCFSFFYVIESRRVYEDIHVCLRLKVDGILHFLTLRLGRM